MTDNDRDVSHAARCVHESFKRTPLHVTGGAGLLNLSGAAEGACCAFAHACQTVLPPRACVHPCLGAWALCVCAAHAAALPAVFGLKPGPDAIQANASKMHAHAPAAALVLLLLTAGAAEFEAADQVKEEEEQQLTLAQDEMER